MSAETHTPIETRIAAAKAKTSHPPYPYQNGNDPALNGFEPKGQMSPGLCHLQLLAEELYGQARAIEEASNRVPINESTRIFYKSLRADYKKVTAEITTELSEMIGEIYSTTVIYIYGDWKVARSDGQPPIFVFGAPDEDLLEALQNRSRQH